MVALAGAVGVALALAGHQAVKGLELLAAVLAGVAAFLAALVGFVETLTRTQGMTCASGIY